MSWNESISIESWAGFKAFAYAHACHAPTTEAPKPEVLYLFRGQNDAAWPLDPSLARDALKNRFGDRWTKLSSAHRLDAANDVPLQKQVIELEKTAFREFSRNASSRRDLRSRPDPNDLVAWLTIMQQFECHTRLLDWTLSPYVAAYMAVKDSCAWKRDGAVWAFDYSAVQDAMKKRYRTPGTPDLPPIETGQQMDCLWEPKAHSVEPKLHAFRLKSPIERLANQHAWFSLSPNIMAEHGNVIEELLGEATAKNCFKLMIPSKEKESFLEELEEMGITEASLFPDLDGLGRDIRQMVDRKFLKLPKLDGAVSGENGA